MRWYAKDTKSLSSKGTGMVNRNVLEARNKYKSSPPLTIYPEQKIQKLTQNQAKQNTKKLTGSEKSANELVTENKVSNKV